MNYPSSPFVTAHPGEDKEHAINSATLPSVDSPQVKSKLHTQFTVSPSSDNNILDLEGDVLERIGVLSENSHSSAALLFRWARHPSFGRLCDWLADNHITGPYIAWLGELVHEAGSGFDVNGDLFAVMDRVSFDTVKAKLNEMADLHTRPATSHLHRIQ